MPELLEVSKRRHNFGTKRFKEKSLFLFNARIVLKSLILLFVRLIARGARIGKTHTQTHRHTDRLDRHTDRTSTVTLAHARRGLKNTPDVFSPLLSFRRAHYTCARKYDACVLISMNSCRYLLEAIPTRRFLAKSAYG